MSREVATELGRKLRDLNCVTGFHESIFLEDSRSSPGALFLSDPAAGLSTSVDGVLKSGAELDGDVSPEALLMPA